MESKESFDNMKITLRVICFPTSDFVVPDFLKGEYTHCTYVLVLENIGGNENSVC